MSFPLDCTTGPLFVAARWEHNGHDVDLSAVCCDFVGNIIDVCYFKQQQVFKDSIVHSGDNRTGQGEDDESITVHLPMLPPEVQFVFFIVNYHDGSPNNVTVRIADGAQAGGHPVTTVELDQKEAANLVAVAVRPFDQAYPPAPWTLQVINQRGDGRTFADSHYLVEGALKGLVDAALAAERRPNDPTKHYDLTKNAAYVVDPSIEMVIMGLGWDTGKAEGIDVDAHAHLCDANFTIVDGGHVYFGNKEYNAGNVVYPGDNRSGEGEGDDETIIIRLDKLDKRVCHIAFYVNIYCGPGFDVIRNCHVRMLKDDLDDKLPPIKMCSFELTEGGPGRARLMCSLSRMKQPGSWSLVAIAEPLDKMPPSRGVDEGLRSSVCRSLLPVVAKGKCTPTQLDASINVNVGPDALQWWLAQ